MNVNFGVFASVDRSVASPVSCLRAAGGIAPLGEPRATTCALQKTGSSITEWKYTKGSWRVA